VGKRGWWGKWVWGLRAVAGEEVVDLLAEVLRFGSGGLEGGVEGDEARAGDEGEVGGPCMRLSDSMRENASRLNA